MPELSELKFKEITAFKPYPHQLKVAKLLREGKSAILCAPTGSGKTEAILILWGRPTYMEIPDKF